MMSGELMTLILGMIRAFLTQTRKDLFMAFFSLCSRGYELSAPSTVWEGVAVVFIPPFLALLVWITVRQKAPTPGLREAVQTCKQSYEYDNHKWRIQCAV